MIDWHWHAIIAPHDPFLVSYIVPPNPFLDIKNHRPPVTERKEEFKLLVEICDKVLISVG